MFYSHFSVPNFKRSVLLCIDADFCVQICVGKRLTRSTNSTFFSGAKFTKFIKFLIFYPKFPNVQVALFLDCVDLVKRFPTHIWL